MVKERLMSLLVVGISWPPETFLVRLLKGMADEGVDVTLATDRRPEQSWLSHPRLHWFHAPSWSGLFIKRLGRLMQMMTRAMLLSPDDLFLFAPYIRKTIGWRTRLERAHQLMPFAGKCPDVIYFPWNSAAITYLPLFDLGCPVVISCRGSQVNIAPHNPKRAPLREGLEVTFTRAAAVHCVSEAIKNEATKYGLDMRKAEIIHPAVDATFFHPVKEQQHAWDSLRIITAGSLNWVKGYEYALQAIRYLIDLNIKIRFDIIGEGSDRQRILYTVYDLGLEDCVHLHGRLSSDQIRDHLQHSDVFLLSSLSEGISNAALEAMACGLPVVTTDCGGMREAITDGVEGFVVPRRNPEATARALVKLYNGPILRQDMGHAARARVLQQFTLAQQVRRFISMAQKLISDTTCSA